MKKIIAGFMVLIAGFASCNKESQPLSKQQINQKVDSITQARTKELDDQSRLDLERRIKIEVKVKVDSMVNANEMQKAKSDPISNVHLAARPKSPAPQPNVIPK